MPALTSRTFLYHISRNLYCTLTSLLVLVIYYGINTYNLRPYNTNESKVEVGTSVVEIKSDAIPELHYILLWGDPDQAPFSHFGEGRSVFEEHNCSWTNCYVTSDRNHLPDYTQFKAVIFYGPSLDDLVSRSQLPRRRSPHQLYVYLSLESAANYPVCTERWNGYFNLTWTYRLDSDLVWRYYEFQNASGFDIAPSASVCWQENKANYRDEDLAEIVRKKRKAAAWFVSNCDTTSMREELGGQIRQNLRNYDLDIDIYGDCGSLLCPVSAMDICLMKLEREYYFYMAFENALSDDYVTEKVVHALNHRTVPIVFGGANYSRFLPPGSYLDAREMGARRTAQRIAELIRRPNEYIQLFNWRHYYRVRAIAPGIQACHLCAAINKHPIPRNTTIQFRRWWTPLTSCRDVIIANLH
ncbi:unnamed protein product [Pieris macdunnoughi]|uniref:Fucosyltransferase n=1 Tax=Pieris macdunnoughi TaxID=345717 RepID=A0A821LIN5_9NEOP|nr:unnamed protein product [Pieris macdunnoughi]